LVLVLTGPLCQDQRTQNASASAEHGGHDFRGLKVPHEQFSYPGAKLGKQLPALHDAPTQDDALG
jgi:hypothetical protein